MPSGNNLVPDHFPYAISTAIIFAGAFTYTATQLTFSAVASPESFGLFYSLLRPYQSTITGFGVVLVSATIWALSTTVLALILDGVSLRVLGHNNDSWRYTITLAFYGLMFCYTLINAVLFAKTALGV